jgi:hypothetical protein
VELDAAEVDHPGQTPEVGDDGEVGGAPAAREDDVHGLEPVRVRVGHALLVEEVSLDSVRVALHLHGPALDVVQDARRQVEVVVDEVAFRQAGAGEVDLVEIRERDVAAADAHPPLVHHTSPIPLRGGPSFWQTAD